MNEPVEIKTFEQKVSAQLQEAKAKIDEIEAHAKGKLAQAELDAIKGFNAKRREIEKKGQDLKTAGEAKAAQVRAEIESDIARLETSIDQFSTKIKSQAAGRS
jgi:hypothetical protein